MKRRALELLCCPVCRGAVALDVFSEDREVREGRLTCEGCGRTFPIIGSIPRLLPDELAHLVVDYHPEFFARHAEAMASYRARCRQSARDASWHAKARTLASYSYQWRTFKEMLPHWEGVFRETLQPLSPSFFGGKVGLDAGCGFGRSLHYAATYGAEVVGVDLSEAVEAAFENTGHLPGVHVVQADLYHLPLRDGALDFIYSIGVLDHLPDPEGGFRALIRCLAPGAPISLWVYSRGRGRQIAVLSLLRSVTTHLPPRLLHLLCWGGAALQWALWIMPYRVLSRFRLTRGLAQRLPFTVHARYPFRVLHADWYDGLSVPLTRYYRQDEITAWYRAAGLERLAPDPQWGREGGGRALGFAPLPALSVESAA